MDRHHGRRSAMGASFRHPVITASADDFIAYARSRSIEIWGADASGEPVGTVQPPPRLALADGNEGAGLSSSIRENAKRLISLPVTGQVESLNVAVAAGILLYQLRK